MAENLLKFVSVPQRMPEIREAAQRKADYLEIYRLFTPQRAAEQASRCSQCGIPFCQVHCPLQNHIPDWLKLTAEGRLEEAYAMSSLTNTFPEICGRICPQDRLCEGNCVIEKGFQSVTIGSIEKYITETAFAEGWVKPIAPAAERPESVGIIGAGPGGLAAADMLRRQGYQVDVYDRYDRVGGLMIYGIPGFKLEKDVVLRRWKLLEEGGVRFHLGVDVGSGVTLAELRGRHAAVLIATGVYRARELETMGSHLPGIIPALTYLTASNRADLGDRPAAGADSSLNANGRRVVVIGGGDTAMDCVRTAVRQGAASVTCLYRRDRENMPGSAREVKHAEDEGVEFRWLASPRGFAGTQRVEKVMVNQMRLSQPDASGRRLALPVEGEGYSLDADLVIKALGFEAEDLPALFGEPELRTGLSGTLAVDTTLQTSLPGVFAAGDIVRGASLVVWAIRDGRDAAGHIHRYIQNAARMAA